MVARIMRKFNKYIKNKTDPQALYTEVVLFIFLAMASAIHVFYMVYFIAVSAFLPAILHTASVSFYILSFVLFSKGKNNFSFIILTYEIAISSVLMVMMFGLYVEYHWFILTCLLLQFLYPANTKRISYTSFVFLFAAIIFTQFSEFVIEPIYTADGWYFLRTINVFFMFLSTLIAFQLDSIVRRAISVMQAKSIDQLKEQVYRDPLTNLLNRRYADIVFTTLYPPITARKVCFAMCDIDDFKEINDTYGHDAGDKFLVAVAELFTSGLRGTDYVFRWGGEEFLILLVNADIDVAVRVLDGLRKKVCELKIDAGGTEVSAGITIGVTVLEGKTTEDAITECDRLLYEGKNNGKNHVRWK